jgi:site-specific DNA-methyltransferase (adenine-specific)
MGLEVARSARWQIGRRNDAFGFGAVRSGRECEMETWHKIIIGDSRDMKEVADESVHLVITSPPYWQLKDYGDGRQIGFYDTYEEYINNLNLVWNGCHRVLHRGCRLCINIGDQFARSVYYGRYKVIPIRTEIIKFCEAAGFDYMGAVIWQKVTSCHTSGGATVMGSFPYPRNGVLKLDYEFILVFRKYGTPPRVAKEAKEQSRLSLEEWNRYFTGHWTFPGERQDRHLAMFPEELPKRLIRMFAFVGETVLDPFLGSGTTSLAARKLKRNSIGYEINENFLPLIRKRLGEGEVPLYGKAPFDVMKQEGERHDFAQQIRKLPYIFRDPISFDKKLDPRSLTFGSRIDSSSPESGEYLSVKEVAGPDTLLLSNGLKVRLLGLKPVLGKRAEAAQFLKQKTRGQKVFMRFDHTKHDSENNLLCYVYLRNKTFLNAHLIKQGLCTVDTSINFRYKSRFLEYEKEHRNGRIEMGL